ncbi:MAG: PCRF domain-containing protein, partial [Candidatus Sericytochromatia bacterium]
MKQRIETLEHKASDPAFWNDQKKAQTTMQELTSVKDQYEGLSRWQQTLDDAEVMLELAAEADDAGAEAEVAESLKQLVKELDNWELTQLLSGQYDNNAAILSVSAGAGGTDAADWAQMLFRMYGRWAEQNGFKAELVDFSANEEAGIKGATLIITGPYAFGKLQAEKGTHRLVRISPFNSAGKRQTAFAGVEVIPEIEADLELDIDPKELRIDT